MATKSLIFCHLFIYFTKIMIALSGRVVGPRLFVMEPNKNEQTAIVVGFVIACISLLVFGRFKVWDSYEPKLIDSDIFRRRHLYSMRVNRWLNRENRYNVMCIDRWLLTGFSCRPNFFNFHFDLLRAVRFKLSFFFVIRVFDRVMQTFKWRKKFFFSK